MIHIPTATETRYSGVSRDNIRTLPLATIHLGGTYLLDPIAYVVRILERPVEFFLLRSLASAICCVITVVKSFPLTCQ
jgi:hypothetical protein